MDISTIFFDMDIYNGVLSILGVRATGDPVKDAVYLLVLPMLTLYLFSDHVSKILRLGKTKLKWVFMGLVFFFVINGGYYKLVADYALFAFILLMIWGAWTFITGGKYNDEGKRADMKVYNMETGGRGSGWFGGSALRKVGQAAHLMSGNYDVSTHVKDFFGLSDTMLDQKVKQIKDEMSRTNDPEVLRNLAQTLKAIEEAKLAKKYGGNAS